MMKTAIKKAFATLLAAVICLAVAAPVAALAGGASSRTYVYYEDFSGDTLNTDQSAAALKASGGLWVNHEAGSQYTMSGGIMTYTTRASKDYWDIRFYDSGMKKDLAQDFILSFRIKPLVDNISFEAGWRDKSQSSFENKLFKVSNGKCVIGGVTYADAVLEKDQWSLVEIAYHYNGEATAVVTEAGEPSKGAIDRITLMLDGVEITTADTTLDFYNIDQFRLFQWATGAYALDDLAIALGCETLYGEELGNDPQEPDAPAQVFNGDILFHEDFADAVNLKGNESSCVAANGFWMCNDNGSTYELSDGVLKYTKRLAKDYMDVRFYYGGTAQDLSRDFILSFKLKPLAPSINLGFSWKDRDHSASDDSVSLSSGRFRGNGKTYADMVLEKDQWYLVEIAFNYNESATAVTGETGAVESYTLMVNGKEVATVDAKVKFHNIDHFRLFQGASCLYEIDDLIVATGNVSLDSDNTFKDWTPKVYYFDKADATSFAYSFCVVGDTQKVTRGYPDKLADLYDWITDNAEKKSIKYVFGLGDITDQDIEKEWTAALTQINKLNGVVPYSVTRGNHDGSENFNKYFGAENTAYTSQFEGFFEAGNSETSYTRIQVGDVKYLMITFDFGPTDEELQWAADIIEANPDHRVIITTHTYLLTDGTTITGDHTHAPTKYDASSNNGDDMWDKLISKYSNIFLVLSGHIGSDYVITNQREGINGNIVTEMLIDPQVVDGEMGPSGMITMLYFSEDGREIAVETYSTINEKYFLEENQFTLDISSWANGIPEGDGDNEEGGTRPGIVIDGKDGKDGKDGADGEDGANGLVPYIGENGNWWIGDKDTGVKARGDDGKDGSDGSDGADGQVLDGGCGAVLGGSAAVIFAVAAAGALLVTKKRR